MRHDHIVPIETRYRGYRFRSRLEARWAVFFDTLGKKWRYEAEGFRLPDGRPYLPDFVVDDWRACIEVKPASLSPTEHCAYISLLGQLEDRGLRTMLIVGEPWPGEYSVWRPLGNEDGEWWPGGDGPYVFAYDRRDADVLTLVGNNLDACCIWMALDRPLTDHEKTPLPHAGLRKSVV